MPKTNTEPHRSQPPSSSFSSSTWCSTKPFLLTSTEWRLAAFAFLIPLVFFLAVLAHAKGVVGLDCFHSWDWATLGAAVIGVGGYMLDARNAREAELRQIHVERAQRQMNELLMPINIEFHSILTGLYAFIGKHAKLASKGEEGDDGGPDPMEWTSVDEIANKWAVWWVWSSANGMSRVNRETGKGAVGVRHEIPRALIDAILSDPSSQLAEEYRRWVTYEWYPGVKRISEIISDAGSNLEAIPVSRLQELFNDAPMGGLGGWSMVPRAMFFSMWVAYARGWDSVLQRWENKDFSVIRPLSPFPFGIFRFIVEGQTVVSEIQKELTGQSIMHGSHGLNVERFAVKDARSFQINTPHSSRVKID